MRNVKKYIFVGLLLLAIFHYETISLGPLKVSHFWKGLVLIILIHKFLKSKNKNIFLYKPLFLIAFFGLFNQEIFINPINITVITLTLIIFVFIGAYSLRFSSQQIEEFLMFFSSFFILSFVPYELGILTSLTEGYNLSSYGVEEIGLIGPFQKVHTASTTLAASLLIVTYFWFKKLFNKRFLAILFVLGFYFLFYTYVRTGMAMFLLGVIPIVYYFTFRNRKTFRLVVVAGIIVSFLSYNLILSNKLLVKRIMGEREYYQEDSFKTVGSGRLKLASSSLEIYEESMIIEKIIGIGETELLNRMKKKTGQALFPHNGFIFLLLTNGLLGLLLFLVFLFNVLKKIKKFKSDSKVLLIALFLAYITMTFLQSYDILNVFLLLALAIGLCRNREVVFKYVNL